MPKDYVNEIVGRLRNLDDRGSRRLASGAILIRENCPRQRGELAYLHAIFAGLSDQEIETLEMHIGFKLSVPLVDFYRQANGMILFGNSLAISGLRKFPGRSADESAWQPIGLKSVSKTNALSDAKNTEVRVGYYSAGPGAEVLTSADGESTVFAVPMRETSPILFEWPTLEEFLCSETCRMIDLFVSSGGNVSALSPFLPPWGVAEERRT